MSDPTLTHVAGADHAAVQECIDRYGGLVWSLARRMSSDATDAEGAVQEIFVELWRNADRLNESIASATIVVAMIARRRLIDRRRRRMRSTEQPGAVSAASLDAVAADRTAIPAVPTRAAAAMKQLSPEQRQVLWLSIHQDHTFEQIAEILSMPLGTVKAHACRGLIRLRDLLDPARADQNGAREAPPGEDALEIAS